MAARLPGHHCPEFPQADSDVRGADAATRYLAAQGIAGSRVRTLGRGEQEPVGSNETEAGRQLNRRIEVAIYANSTARSSR